MRFDLFLISFLTLFLELTCIRWFPSHVLFLTFFTNTVLLASILGISVGCLAANRKSNLLLWTPLILMIALGSAHLVEWQRQTSASVIDVGNQASPQMVFFGVEYQARDLSSFVIPIEAICGYFFLLIALAMMGPGQQLGRALARVPNRLEAYTHRHPRQHRRHRGVRGVLVPRAAADLVVRDRDGRLRRGSSCRTIAGVASRWSLGPALVLVLSVAPAGARGEGPRQHVVAVLPHRLSPRASG